MTSPLNEAVVEEAALGWLKGLGWQYAYGPDIGPDGATPERESYGQVVLGQRLRDALAEINPALPAPALQDAFRRVTRPEGATLEQRNRAFHRMLFEGVNVEYPAGGGAMRGANVKVIDFDNPSLNDWLAVNQFTVVERNNERRPDIVLFVNGLPLGVIELKNPLDKDADAGAAWNQLQTYKVEIPSLFDCNELLMISDGMEARMGSLTAGLEWFKPWRTITGEDLADPDLPQLQVMLQGVCDQQRCLNLIHDFVVFEGDDSGVPVKKIARYYQFHAVQAAMEETLRAAALQLETAGIADSSGRYESGQLAGGDPGDRRIGVVWHNPGSGKSLTMACFAGALIRHRAMDNPTIMVLTDRNDLDGQLHGEFSRWHELLRQVPVQADTRADLRDKLSVRSGGVVFTTIQKFLPEERGDRFPMLSDRRNIVVIADEAHRSQYDFIDGYARHMRDALPNASFIGFTGTPIELADANTRAVFGNYISIYDVVQSQLDGSTVPIVYESRIAQLALDEDEKPTIDPDFDEATEGEEVEQRERLKTRWAQLEAVVGAPKRIKLVAEDIVQHYEAREEAQHGKAMVIGMSRRICVELYNEIVALRPEWRHDDDDQGIIKVVMTGSASDPVDWQGHIRNKPRRDTLRERFRKAEDPLSVVIVRDMWLTGVDVPSMHTMYVDKPMRDHGLIQAINRVNRVFKDKPGGLVVDYLGLAQELKTAVANFTRNGRQGNTELDINQAVAVMLEKHEICCNLFYGFDWSAWTKGAGQQLTVHAAALNHILALDDGKNRLNEAVRALSQAFALASTRDEATGIRDDVRFFQHVNASLAKPSTRQAASNAERDLAVRQIISRAVAPEGVLDVFAAAGLEKPEIGILTEEFLAEVANMPQRNLAVELLERLLQDELTTRKRQNVVQARSFAEMLERTIRRYQNRAIEAAQVIEELVGLAREMQAAHARGEELGLTDDELAFYDALETNDSAVAVLGDEKLALIARELVETIRNSVTIDWTLRENVRAQLRVRVRRLLARHGYPPDKRAKAVATVLEQAEALSEDWAVQ